MPEHARMIQGNVASFAVAYARADAAADPRSTLARIGFAGSKGDGTGLAIDSGFRVWARSPLLPEGDLVEAWTSPLPVRQGEDGPIRYSDDGTHLFGVIEVDEAAVGSIEAAARFAYARIVAFLRDRPGHRILRYWNYFSRINEGLGDAERYRRFCTGRAEGLGSFTVEQLPAATAIGRQDDSPMLQVYWLAAREAGWHIENPRQVSAYRYPRRYGPTSPSFSRAHLLPEGRLLISGTASVVGHESHHVGNLAAQFAETRSNLESLVQAARRFSERLPQRIGPNGLLKAYLRDRADLDATVALMAQFQDTPWIIVGGDICRSDLLIEIDGLHG